jgi:hypothetical protein
VKLYKNEVKQWSVVEVKSYTRKTLPSTTSDGIANIIMMIKDFRVIYNQLRSGIGQSLNYTDRLKLGHFGSEAEN